MKNKMIKFLFLSFFLVFIGCEANFESKKCKYDGESIKTVRANPAPII